MLATDKWKVSLTLDKADCVYYAGQEIAGIARVELDEPIHVIGVELRLLGCEWVSLADKQASSHQASEKSSQRLHLDQTLVLWGAGRRESNVELEELSKGRHLFPFKWTLPTNLPCSFESPNGCIRYSAHVTIMMPCCNSKGCNTKRPTNALYFTLLNHVDLNKQKAASTPTKEETEVPVASRRFPLPSPSLCGRSGLVTCSLTLTRTAYVPGEYLFAEAHIHNLSTSVKVKKSRCVFYQVLTYRIENQFSRRTKRAICQCQGDDVKPGYHQTWAITDQLIPTIPPSNLGLIPSSPDRLIDVTYELQLEVEVQAQTISVAVPILIGTMPPLESNLTLWSHNEGVIFKSKKHASLKPPVNEVTCNHPEQQPCEDFYPKYRVYKVAPPGAGMLAFDMSPGERRRSYRLSLYPADESCV